MPARHRAIFAITLVAAAAALVGCSGSDAQPGDVVTEEPGLDRTGEVQALAGPRVLSAVEDSSTLLEIETDIVDPRGDAGSAEALEAIAICEAAQAIEGPRGIWVFEADGTSFVVATEQNGGVCTEY